MPVSIQFLQHTAIQMIMVINVNKKKAISAS